MREFLLCAVWLTVSSLLSRTVSLSFSTYLKEKVGAGGMGLFSLVSSVCTLALTFATSGIGLAASKLTAEAIGSGSGRRVRSAVKHCLCYALIAGGSAGTLLFLLAEPIGAGWLQDGRTVLSLRAFALSLPAVSCSSALSGYFSAMRRVRAPAVTRVIEQGTKIGATVLLLSFFAPRGLEYACLSVVLGGAGAELLSFVIDLSVFLYGLRRVEKTGDAGGSLTRPLLSVTLPIAFSSYVRSGLTTLEHTLIPRCLRKFGQSSEDSLASYGRLTAMAMPLLFFPASLLYAFTGLLVPEFAERASKGEKKRITFLTGKMIRYTICFGIGSATLLLGFSGEIGTLLYGSSEVGRYLFLLAPLVPVMYLDSAVDAMLKGLGKQVYCMAVNIADAGISVLLVLLFVPKRGVEGYILVIILSEIVNAAFSLFRLYTVTGVRPRPFRRLLLPLLSGVGAANLARSALFFLVPRLGMRGGVLLSMLLCAASYAFFLFSFGAIDRKDTEWVFGVSPRRGGKDRKEGDPPAPRSSPSLCRSAPRYASDRPFR